MKALIIYDDFTAAAKANAMLLGASAWAEEGLRWDVHPWRLEMLRPSPAGDLARAEAVDAHLIVFAVGHARSLPAELIAWLHQWALGRQVPDAALAVFESQQGGGLAAEATPELTEFARQHGLMQTRGSDTHSTATLCGGGMRFPRRSRPILRSRLRPR